MSKEELFKKYQEIILKTNGGNDDYVVALCQIGNLIKQFTDSQDNQLAELKAENKMLKEELLFCKTFDNKKLMEEGLKEASEIIEFKNQQLKEKEQEIERLKEELEQTNVGYNFIYEQSGHTIKELAELLKTNTKQVCEKIIERYNLENKPITDIFGDTQYGYVMVSAKDLKQFLERIKKGEV